MAFDYRMPWLGESLHIWQVKSVFPWNLGRELVTSAVRYEKLALEKSPCRVFPIAIASDCWGEKAFSSSTPKTQNKKEEFPDLPVDIWGNSNSELLGFSSSGRKGYTQVSSHLHIPGY